MSNHLENGIHITEDEMERVLTAQEAADVIGCTEGRVRQMCIKKTMKSAKLDGKWIIPVKEARRVKALTHNCGRPRVRPQKKSR